MVFTFAAFSGRPEEHWSPSVLIDGLDAANTARYLECWQKPTNMRLRGCFWAPQLVGSPRTLCASTVLCCSQGCNARRGFFFEGETLTVRKLDVETMKVQCGGSCEVQYMLAFDSAFACRKYFELTGPNPPASIPLCVSLSVPLTLVLAGLLLSCYFLFGCFRFLFSFAAPLALCISLQEWDVFFSSLAAASAFGGP